MYKNRHRQRAFATSKKINTAILGQKRGFGDILEQYLVMQGSFPYKLLESI